MICEIGVDVVDLSRFIDLPISNNEKFYDKVFTEREKKYCLSKVNPYERFAVRFAAKEAVIKAVGKTARLSYKEIEVLNNGKGEPYITFLTKGPKLINEENIHISLAHTEKIAIAFVVYINL